MTQPPHRRGARLARLSLAWLLLSTAALAQQSFFARYQARVRDTQAAQPHWSSPLVATAPRLEQGLRTDFVNQRSPRNVGVWNFGNNRGLQLIPARRIELRFSYPPFLAHTGPAPAPDGFGDVSFLFKYRIHARSEENGNRVVSAWLATTIPTGKNGTGSCCATVTPTVAFGKGFGRLALTSTLGGTLPVSNTRGLGRQIVWNNAVQLRATRYLWLQTEWNATSFHGGRNDGQTQLLATPGLVFSRIPLLPRSHAGAAPLSLSLGAGEQIAVTHFATYTHAPIFSLRLRF